MIKGLAISAKSFIFFCIFRLEFAIEVIVASAINLNKYLMFEDKENIVQYALADKMNSYGMDDYELLYFGKLDEEFYAAAKKYRNIRFLSRQI